MAKKEEKSVKKAQPAVEKKAKVKFPEKYTAQTITNYISEKHNISKIIAKEIIEDFCDVITAGALEGQRVPLGKVGKLYVKIRPATKPRMGRNPITGEEIKIAAKKATKVPKFTFGKAFKEIALKAKVTK